MSLKVNLVLMLMAVICMGKTLLVRPHFITYNDNIDANGPDTPSLDFLITKGTNSIRSNRDRRQIAKHQNRGFLDDANDALEDAKSAIRNVHTYVKQAVEPRKRHKDKRMMALLMAYKLKLMALIPIMIGGMILLSSTTALAGFFFALFAAVLGLRAK